MGKTVTELSDIALRTIGDTNLLSQAADWFDEVLDEFESKAYWRWLYGSATHQTVNNQKSVLFSAPEFPSLDDTGANSASGLAVGSTPEQVANGAFDYQIAGVSYSKVVDAAGSVFSAVHKIAAGTGMWGGMNFYIDAAGDISSRVPGTQTGTQAFASSALVEAALEEVDAPTNLAFIGRVIINNDATLWTANTDDLTDASDVTTAAFTDATPVFFTLALTNYSKGLQISSDQKPYRLTMISKAALDKQRPATGAPSHYALEGGKPGREKLSVWPTPITGAESLPLLILNFYENIKRSTSGSDDVQDDLGIPRRFNEAIINGLIAKGTRERDENRHFKFLEEYRAETARLIIENDDFFTDKESRFDRSSLIQKSMGLNVPREDRS